MCILFSMEEQILYSIFYLMHHRILLNISKYGFGITDVASGADRHLNITFIQNAGS